MLGTVFLEMIPESVETSHGVVADSAGAGYLIVHFFEHTFAAHLHFGEETHHDEMNLALGVSAFIGMLVHTFFDGVAIGAGFSVSGELGFLVFLAMFLHKIPDGFTIASIVRSTGHGPARALAASTLLGISTLIGVLAFYAAGAPPFALTSRRRLHAVRRRNGPDAGSESRTRRQDGASGFCGDGIVSAGESDRAGAEVGKRRTGVDNLSLARILRSTPSSSCHLCSSSNRHHRRRTFRPRQDATEAPSLSASS